MTRFSKIMLSATALVLAPLAPALAADYEPPVVVNAPDQFVPVEVGTGWYLRGDVAYGVNKSFKNINFAATPVSYRDDETTFSGSIGFGYHFTDWLRADLNLGYLPGGNKEFATRSDTTLAALAAALDLVSAGGIITVVCYPGHAGGQDEQDAVLAWARSIPSIRATVVLYQFWNANKAPCLLAITPK